MGQKEDWAEIRENESQEQHTHLEYSPFLIRTAVAGYLVAHFLQVGTYDPSDLGFQNWLSNVLGNPTSLTSMPVVMFYSEVGKGILALSSDKLRELFDREPLNKLQITRVVDKIGSFFPEIVVTSFAFREIVQEITGFGYKDSFWDDLFFGLLGYAIVKGNDIYKQQKSKQVNVEKKVGMDEM